MKKLIKIILFFLYHKTNEFLIVKTEYKSLLYCEYIIYSNYKILLLLNYKVLLYKVNSLLINYHDLYNKLYMNNNPKLIKEINKIK